MNDNSKIPLKRQKEFLNIVIERLKKSEANQSTIEMYEAIRDTVVIAEFCDGFID